MNFSVAVRHAPNPPMTNQLYFGANPNLDPGTLSPNPGFLMNFWEGCAMDQGTIN